MKRWFGRVLCTIGLHDWYEGVTKCYCLRCNEILFQLYDDGSDLYD